MRKQLFAVSLISISCIVTLAKAELSGLWEFDHASNLTKATVGNDLIRRGGGQSAVTGVSGSDGAAAVEAGTYYQCDHGIGANGGGSYVNEFTLLFDVMYPQQSAGKWRAFYQSGYDAYNDSEYFIHPADESWGVGDLGYTDNGTVGQFHSSHSTWYRVVLTVNLDDNSGVAFHDLYINGKLEGNHNTGNLDLDGRFSLYPADAANPYVVLAGDDNGDDALMHFSNIAIWGQPLTSQEIADLGGPGDPILNNRPGVKITETAGATAVTESEGSDTYDVVLRLAPSANVQITATPSDGQIDLGAGPGQPVTLDFTAGDWDTPQTVSVTAVDDDVYEGKITHTSNITHTAASDDEDYDEMDIGSVEVSVLDNELTCGDWGYLAADLNFDCYVDFRDYALLVSRWLDTTQ